MTKQRTISKTKPKKTGILTLLISLVIAGSYWTAEQVSRSDVPHSNEEIALYSNQTNHNLQQGFKEAVSSAKKNILLIVYSLSDEEMIRALRQKAEEGVNVSVIFDGKSTPFADRKLGPKVNVLKRFGDGLMHMKILVIDNSEVWLGSANMTTESLKMHGNLVLAFKSPELAAWIANKGRTFPEEGKCQKCPHRDFVFKDQKLELWFLPSSDDPVARIKQVIASAKKTIRVAMFTWTHMDLAKSIVEASERGVKVEVVVDHYSGKGAGAAVVKYLKKNKIPVGMSPGGNLLHHKFLYVDGKLLINGSTNWTKSAFAKNDDCFVVINTLNEQQRKTMEKLWKVIKKEAVH